MVILPATPKNIARAVQCLKNGGLVGMPTETVYGLGADASNPDAVKRIFAAKNRPENHPLIVHIASIEQLTDWAQDIPESAYQLAQHFCPAPLAFILKKRPNVSGIVTGGQNTVALRIPNHPVALELLRQFDGGIAAPSANRFCRISPTQAQHVADELGDDVDLILDGGACQIGVESTIVDLSGDKPTILRFGQITRSEIEAVLQTAVFIPDSLSQTTVRTAGMMAIHYAPTTPAFCCETHLLLEQLKNETQKIGVLTCGSKMPETANLTVMELPANAVNYAQNLYAKLRELDALKFDFIVVEKPPQNEAWAAINDRLSKATREIS